jgi:hypothetical protein
MNRFASTLVAVAVVLAVALPALAQQKRLSPHETISGVVSGDRVMIVYGRPYTKSPRTGEIRKIWGGLVPYWAEPRFPRDATASGHCPTKTARGS